MKKIFFLFFINLMGTKLLFSQFEENLTNGQFNKVITAFKGQRSDFGSYYLNNFPCTACSGGYFFINNNSNLSALYSYKGVNFTGTLNRPHLKYDIKGNTLYVSSNWNNTGSNGGYKSAYISFEYSFRSDFNNWNTILRFISGNTEMVAYYNLTRKQLDDIYSFVLNDTKYNEYLVEIERKISIERQKILIQDSLKKIEENIKDSLNKERIKNDLIAKKALDLEIAITKRIKDSIDLKYDDSLRYTLQVLDVYKDGIVIKVDGNGHGILISTLQLINKVDASSDNWINLMLNKLSENGWELPVKGGEVISIFEKMYKNENFRYKFKGSKEKEYFRFSMHYNNKENVMAFLVGNMPWEILGKSNEDYSKNYFFGFKSF